MFLNSYQREFEITLKFLNALPQEHADFRPSAQFQSAIELAWMFPEEDRIMIGGALDGDVVFKNNTAPETINEVITAYRKSHQAYAARINDLADEEFGQMITFGSGAEASKQMRRGDVLWLAIMDGAHHRGQFSVYIRLSGGKVPTLYAPSDEPSASNM